MEITDPRVLRILKTVIEKKNGELEQDIEKNNNTNTLDYIIFLLL